MAESDGESGPECLSYHRLKERGHHGTGSAPQMASTPRSNPDQLKQLLNSMQDLTKELIK